MIASTHGFALIPDRAEGRPHRIIRPTTFATGDDTLVSMLDDERNILWVNKPLYDVLTDAERNTVTITHERFLHVKQDEFGAVVLDRDYLAG